MRNGKKVLAFALSAVIAGGLFNTAPAVETEAKDEEIVLVSTNSKGDVTLDNDITLQDAVLCLQAALGITELTPQQEQAADLFDEGCVTLKNVNIILREALGIEYVDMVLYGIDYVVNKNISVDVDMDKEQYAPGEAVHLKIKVKNNGKMPIEIGAETGMFGKEGCIRSYVVDETNNIMEYDNLISQNIPVTTDIFRGTLESGETITVDRKLLLRSTSGYYGNRKFYIDVMLKYYKNEEDFSGQYHSKVLINVMPESTDYPMTSPVPDPVV